MAVELSYADRDLINRVVATEADHRLAKSNPDAYFSQVAGIVDTILNRVASPEYPNTVADVVNQKNQFSAINGPTDRDYTVWGSAAKVPDSVVPAPLPDMVGNYLNQRIDGRKSSVGGNLNYANPKYSDAKNLEWIEALDGPRFGDGDSVHYHGTTKGSKPVEAVLAGDAYNGSGVKLPPGSVPDYGVGTLLDVRQAAGPQASDVAARTNRMFDRADPAPRSQGTAARTNAMLTRDQAVRDTPLPRARPTGIEPAQTQNASPRAELPPIGPTGGPPLTRTQPVAPNSTAGSVQMAPGMRPAAADTLVHQAENAQRHNTLAANQSYAGQDGAAPRAPASVAAPMPEKYITTFEKKQIPLGEVAHKYSRDAAPRIKAGEEAAERYKTVNRKVTTLNPEWVQAQQPAQPAVNAPASKAPVVGKPAEAAEENWGQQIIGGVREAVGLPREGLGPGIVNGVQGMLGMNNNASNAVGMGRSNGSSSSSRSSSSSSSSPDMGTVAGRTQVIDGALKQVFNRPREGKNDLRYVADNSPSGGSWK